MGTKRAALRPIVACARRIATNSSKRHIHHLPCRHTIRLSSSTPSLRAPIYWQRELHTSSATALRDDGQHESSAVDVTGAENPLDAILMLTLENAVSEVTRGSKRRWVSDSKGQDDGRPEKTLKTGWDFLGEEDSDASHLDAGLAADDFEVTAFSQAPGHETDNRYESDDPKEYGDFADLLGPADVSLDQMDPGTAVEEAVVPPQKEISEECQAYVTELEALLQNTKSLADRQSLGDRIKWARLNGDTAESAASNWRRCFDIMKRISPEGESFYARHLETITLPAGKRLTWLRDPYSTVAELLHWTNCEFAVPKAESGLRKAGTLPTSFSSFTLYGTVEQIASARHFITASGKFSVESTSAEQARIPQASSDNLVGAHRDHSVDIPVQPHKPGSKWSIEPDDRPVKELLATALGDTEISDIQLLKLVVSIMRLHSQHDIHALRSTTKIEQPQTIRLIEHALRAVLTKPSNVEKTTKTAAWKAFDYLAARRKFDTIRQIIAAHDQLAATSGRSAFPAIDTSAYNYILRTAVKVSDAAMFLSVLKDISKRKLKADAITWNLFHDLTVRCHPATIEAVKSKMDKLGTLHDESAMYDYLSQAVPRKLERWLQSQNVNPSQDAKLISDFLNREVRVHVKLHGWLNTARACKIVDVLFSKDLSSDAYYVLEQMNPFLIRPKLFQRFLQAELAKAPVDDPARMVNVVQRFHACLASRRGALTHFYKHGGFLEVESRFRCALHSRSWNLLRTIWHHACREGHVTTWMRHKMRYSLIMAGYKTKDTHALSEKEIWDKNYARFAMDIPANDADVTTNLELLDKSIDQKYKQVSGNTFCIDVVNAWQRDCRLRGIKIWPVDNQADTSKTMKKIDVLAYPVRRATPSKVS